MSWTDFLTENRISSGRTSSTNTYIKCPLCSNDPSMHMGLSLNSSEWGCLRDAEHRGANPAKLIQILLHCSYEDAQTYARHYFKRNWTIQTPVAAPEAPKILQKPSDFMPFTFKEPLERVFIDYLRNRGFDPAYTITRFKLHWAVTGQYEYRLIIPVIFDDNWYCWTSRAINPKEKLRYLSAKGIDNKLTDFLFDEENLTGGKALIIAEGPFDAMKIASAIIPNVSATSLFGKVLNPKQIKSLIRLKDYYDHMYIALDKDVFHESFALTQQLCSYITNISPLKPAGKDWGDMTKAQIKDTILQKV